jgi:Domain of unknown function (DUF4157)
MRTVVAKPKEPQQTTPAKSTLPSRQSYGVNSILRLQRIIGNQAVQRLLQDKAEELKAGSATTASTRFAHDFSRIRVHHRSSAIVQAKLAVSSPADIYEQEADRLSEQVINMSASESPHACPCGGVCSNCQIKQLGQEHEPMQTKRTGSNDLGQGSVPAIVDEVLRLPGESLDPQTRANMEPRFSYDFSNVRVHTNERAAESAQAVNALAYTVGDDIVFGRGQYAPFISAGQKLLAHELAHVVQQGGGQTSDNGVGGQHVIARAPSDVIARKLPPDLSEEIPPTELHKKRTAIKKHEDEQRTVIDLMDKARKIPPDPKKDLSDPDNLLRNTVQMFDAGRFRLTVLSPSHYSKRLHFDPRVKHPKIGGDYPLLPPKDEMTPGAGLTYEPGAYGRFEHAPSGAIGSIQTMPPKVERTSGEAAPKETPAPAKISTSPPTFSPFAQGDIFLFTHGLDVESRFRQTFVHEGQHVADLSTQRIAASPVDEKLEAYKSEFRAFWMQPPLVRTSELAVPDTRFAEPTEKASNSRQVTIDPQKRCSTCPPNEPSGKPFAEPKTAFKNARQEEIFWHVIDNYPNHGYDCCYVFNEQFHKAVNEFAHPESINLINSERLMNLDLELQNLKKDMTRSQVGGTNLVGVLTKLEPLDWAFLNHPKLAKPFWDTLNANAPEFVKNGVKGLLKKGMKMAVSEAEAKKALSR